MMPWPIPLRWILLAVLVAALAIGIPVLWSRHNAGQQQIGYDRRAAEDRAAMEAQAADNLRLQRAAEKNYVVQGEVRDRFIVQTVREIRDAAAPLAACPVPDPVRVRLNAAAACASGDTAGSCEPGEPLPAAR